MDYVNIDKDTFCIMHALWMWGFEFMHYILSLTAFLKIFIYLFIYGCVGSLLLCAGFL